MKINYNIIWVDDKIENGAFVRLRDRIEGFLTDQFFKVEIEIAEDFEGFKEIFIPQKEYDLIITDLNLNDSKGSEIINYIRKDKNLLTEVFFYSANTDVSNVDLINSSRISYFRLDDHNLYAELQKKLEEVISLTIAKFEHIVSMRGMIMHETSVLDEQSFEMVCNYIISNDDEVRAQLYEELISFFERKYNLSSRCQKNNNINNIINDPLLLTSAQRANVLSAIIEKKGLENFIEDFKKEVINVRNQFAHAVLEIDADGREFFKNKKEDIDFNSDYCKVIRRNIIKHKNNLDDLSSSLNL